MRILKPSPDSAGADLTRQGGCALLRSWLFWAVTVVLLAKSASILRSHAAWAPPDFMGFYYGAKLLGQVDIYDRPAFLAAVRADAEQAVAPPLEPQVQAIAPAPQPIYPPSAFVLLKPFTWIGIRNAIQWQGWLSILFAWGTAVCAGLVAARVLKYAPAAPFAAAGLLGFFVLSPAYATNLSFGQLNLAVAFGLTATLWLATLRPGLAAAILVCTLLLKPSGALVALPLAVLWLPRFLTLLPAVLLAVVLGLAPWPEWSRYLSSARTGSVATWVSGQVNQPGSSNSSVEAIARAAGGTPAQVAGLRYGLTLLYLAAFGLLLYGFVRGRLALEGVFAGAVLAAFLIGPVSWTLHVVYLVPFLVLSLMLVWKAHRAQGLPADQAFTKTLGFLAVLLLVCLAPLTVEGGALARLNVLVGLYWHPITACVLFTLVWTLKPWLGAGRNTFAADTLSENG